MTRRRQVFLTPDILAQYSAGTLTVPEIAAQMGVTRGAIHVALRQIGAQQPRNRQPAGNWQNQALMAKAGLRREVIQARRDAGETLAQIAASLGVSKQRVHQILSR